MPASFLSAAEIAGIHQDIGDAYKTVQELQDPAVTVSFTRSGSTVASNVTLIRIRLDNILPGFAGFQQGAVEATASGSLKAWATDVAAILPGDKFIWAGIVCKVTSVEPARSGVTTMRFGRLGGVAS